MSDSLYERLGGSEGVTKIAYAAVANHAANPVIAKRFADVDIPKAQDGAAKFFIMATGGPNEYQGKDMIGTHKGMNINNDEFVAVLEDALAALRENDVGQREQEEVLFVLFGLKDEVVGQ